MVGATSRLINQTRSLDGLLANRSGERAINRPAVKHGRVERGQAREY